MNELIQLNDFIGTFMNECVNSYTSNTTTDIEHSTMQIFNPNIECVTGN